MQTTITRTEAGDHWNEGARQAWIAMRAKGWRQADLNRALGEELATTPRNGYANRFLFGLRRPGYTLAKALERILNVPRHLWGEPALAPFDVEMTKTVSQEAA